jgi:hypothetical protein
MDNVAAFVTQNPGLTETEIAIRLYGSFGYQQRVNAACRKLLQRAGSRDAARAG